MNFSTHLTCPVWRSGGHRSSSPVWSRTPVGRYDMASFGRSGRRGTQPEHHGMGSRRRQTPPLGLRRSGSHPDNQPCIPKRCTIELCLLMSCYILTSIFYINLLPFILMFLHVYVYYLVDSKKTHAEVLVGSLNWFISLSLSEAVVLPSSPLKYHTTNEDLNRVVQ